MAYDFNVVVLGAGPGGYTAAVRAAQLGLSAAVVEERYWGGVCLNVGCIPSKALLRNAELAHIITSEQETFGIRSDAPISLDYGVAFDRSREVADGRVKGVHYLMRKNAIAELNGRGRFVDAHTMIVEGDEGPPSGHLRLLRHCRGCDNSTASGTSLSERVVTYEEQILDRDLPGSIVIAGGGRHRRRVRVRAAQLRRRGDHRRIPRPARPDGGRRGLRRACAPVSPARITMLTSTRVESIDDSGAKVRVTVSKDGAQQVLETDRVLQAIGFQPRTTGYGLEQTGVALTDRGAIDVDMFCRTNVPTSSRSVTSRPS